MSKRTILLVEPFFSGSHQRWAEELVRFSNHQIELLTLPGRHWKWRMHIGAVELANQANSKAKPDLILATDMLDVATFRSLYIHSDVPVAVYFHENQITYPFGENEHPEHDRHYGWLNFTSLLAADKVLFNSDYHRLVLMKELRLFLSVYPDYSPIEKVDEIETKSETLFLGMDLSHFDEVQRTENQVPVVLWNHRWEYDKNPELFFKTLFKLQDVDFQLIVLGSSTNKYPSIFKQAKTVLASKIIHWGYAESREEYVSLTSQADVLPVTSNQDFFGGSVVEAMYAHVHPILPNRLAYPDYFSSDLCYESDADFEEKLREFLRNPSQKISYKKNVEQFDWRNCISKYDRVFSELIKN